MVFLVYILYCIHTYIYICMYFPSGSAVKMQCRRCRCGFSPCVGKIPWRRTWKPTQVFLPGEFHGQRSLVAAVRWVAKSWTRLKWLSDTRFCKCHQRHLQNIFVISKRNPIRVSYHTTPPSSSHPKQPLICLMSLLGPYSLGLPWRSSG